MRRGMGMVAEEAGWTAEERLRELARGTRRAARHGGFEERAELLRIAERLEAAVAEMERRTGA
ncbi:hypothetical protein ACE7GA_14105 [Roseomonas sp. CCTCC AB2023176]|uniref:hypothetical protein n=1 Tax=Roseomonas sp. CCTCC AB2023176 TaxID=3342640 RepID=UPI0035DA42F0